MQKLKIAIIGITGRIGKRVAAELLAAGDAVTGANRRPERVKPVLDKLGLSLPTVQVDTGNYDETAAFVAGADAVVLAIAPTREHPETYPEQNANVLRACKAAGVGRLVAMSNFMALRAPDGRPMMEAAPPHPAFYNVECVHEQVRDIFFQEGELDWLLVAPAADLIPYGAVTNAYTVQENTLVVTDPNNPNFLETSRLTMEDLAHFIAGEVHTPTWHRKLVALGYSQAEEGAGK